jgi:cysteinyl-tRNA synthetase
MTNEAHKNKFMDVLTDDLNTPQAIALVWELVKNDSVSNADKKTTLEYFDKALGLDIENQAKILKEESENIPEEIKELVKTRDTARVEKDFEKADIIRAELSQKGYSVMDTEAGSVIKKTKS